MKQYRSLGGSVTPRSPRTRVVRRAGALGALVAVCAMLAACTGASVGAPSGSPGTSQSVAAPDSAPSGTAGTPGTAGTAGTGSTAVTVPPPDGTGATGSGNSSVPASPTSDAPLSTPPATTSTSEQPKPVATVTAVPAFGSRNLSVVDPITVSVSDGTITAFTLTNPDGKKVKGEISQDGHSWTLGEVLGFGKTYTASGSARGTDGRTVPIEGTFATVAPGSTVNARINIGDGAVVGVAAPIMVTFGGVDPADRALIEKHISVTTEPKVTGAWGWINHDGGVWGLDFRTKDFWPAGTKVHVSADIYGLDFGAGRYGAADVTSDFTIGRNQVVYADVNSYNLVVKRNGEVAATYPASYGRGTDYNTTTRSGIHVINDFFTLKLMSNPRYGYRNYPAKWAVRISNNGEFIHANDGTVGEQGSSNVSHGCVNLSTANAKKFYDSSLYGDPVIITGTDVKLSPSDGDIFDWAIPWSQWVTLSALH